MTAYDWFCAYLAALGSFNSGNMWQCPAHDDGWPSLSVREGQSGSVLVHCFGGCSNDAVLRALNLSKRAYFEPHPWSPEKAVRWNKPGCRFASVSPRVGGGTRHGRGRPVAIEIHGYTPDVRLARERFQDGSKGRVSWEVRRADGFWYPSRGDVDLPSLPLYCERDVLAAVILGEWVVLCESESSVDALYGIGMYATTWAGGASSPNLPRLTSVLTGARVLLVPDHDTAGLQCAAVLRRELAPAVAEWRELLGMPGDDARDLVRKGVLSLDAVSQVAA